MTTSFSKLFLSFLLLLFANNIAAQDNFSSFLEPDISINLDRPNRWSFNFGLANRNGVYSGQETEFDTEFIELSHFSSYEVGFYGKLSLGIRYRFNEMFNERAHDEIRITQQYSRSRNYNALKIAHRFRFEQRLRSNTIYRTRYQFSVQIPLNGERVDQKEFFVKADTEALYNFSKANKPGLSHRFGLALGRELNESITADFGTEYRLDDYNLDPAHELFFVLGLTLSI
ncbi:DUF2490 domain-containing protein [Gramella sp. MT6]|uniref:DUF2490 domain-containing protein n=1 Tax=Gramella sp. MT6 TaxID=2705471 RepID=UPI001C5F3350|nr:DUF2490 domain-containing protein [Gramella sp. MT6]QYA25126.1 DUF2490 domain-containing protein [Gramella sp. MT6]